MKVLLRTKYTTDSNEFYFVEKLTNLNEFYFCNHQRAEQLLLKVWIHVKRFCLSFSHLANKRVYY